MFSPLDEYFAKPHFAAITVAGHFGHVFSSFVDLEADIFAHSAVEKGSDSIFQVLPQVLNTSIIIDLIRSIVALPLCLANLFEPLGLFCNLTLASSLTCPVC